MSNCTDYIPCNDLFPWPQRCKNCHQLGHDAQVLNATRDRFYQIPHPFMRWLYRRWLRLGFKLFARYTNDAYSHTWKVRQG